MGDVFGPADLCSRAATKNVCLILRSARAANHAYFAIQTTNFEPRGRVFDAALAKQVVQVHKLPPEPKRFMIEDALIPVEADVEEVPRLHPGRWCNSRQKLSHPNYIPLPTSFL
jgi:hypothetical protein